MKDLMIHLETLGTGPDAVIVSIGAVFFEPAKVEFGFGHTFYAVVNLASAMNTGGKIDAHSIKWWLSQPKHVRSEIERGTSHIATVLRELSDFVCEDEAYLRVRVWGNAGFDNVILRSAYERCNIPAFWRNYDDRDVRTIIDVGELMGIDLKKEASLINTLYVRVGRFSLHNNGLDNAIEQAKLVSVVYQKLTAGKDND